MWDACEGMWMTHRGHLVSMWMVCGRCMGGVCLAPGVLQRHQATVLPLWQFRGEFEGSQVGLEGGPAGCQALSVIVFMCS